MFKIGQTVRFHYKHISPHISRMADYDNQVGRIIRTDHNEVDV